MSNGGIRDRASLVSSLSFLIASISLVASFYQGYFNTKNLEIVQRDVSRREYIRSCKEIIETYFDVKLKVGLITAMADHERPAGGVAMTDIPAEMAAACR